MYLPVDDRAEFTLNTLFKPFIDDILLCENIKEIIRVIITHLPFGIAYETELRIRMRRDIINIPAQKHLVITILRNIILADICQNLVSIIHNDEKDIFYMKEDIVRWYKTNPIYIQYFPIPPSEIITIEITKNNITKTSKYNAVIIQDPSNLELTLTEEQIMGIAYAINAIKNNNIKLLSSITNGPISVSDIVEHSLIYRLPIILATEELKRPYRVDILQIDNSFLTVHFTTPEFMQGILSVANWCELSDNGKNILWKNLYQFTREGLLPLDF